MSILSFAKRCRQYSMYLKVYSQLIQYLSRFFFSMFHYEMRDSVPLRIDDQVHLRHNDFVFDQEMISEVRNLIREIKELETGQTHRWAAPFGGKSHDWNSPREGPKSNFLYTGVISILSRSHISNLIRPLGIAKFIFCGCLGLPLSSSESLKGSSSSSEERKLESTHLEYGFTYIHPNRRILLHFPGISFDWSIVGNACWCYRF